MGLNPRLDHIQRLVREGAPAILAAALIGILVVGLEWGGAELRDALSFHRVALADGEAWRALSGHFVHLGLSHALLNAAGVLLVAVLLGREFSLAQWAIIGLVSLAAISAGLWWLNPDLVWYVGLSGVLHGWLMGGIVAALWRRRADAWFLALLFVAKLAFEQWQGAIPGSAETAGGPVVVDAHLYGAIGGALASLAVLWFGSRSSAHPRQSREGGL